MDNFYIGILLLVCGILYGLWNLNKEQIDNSNIFSKINVIYSWGLVIIFIISGLIMIFKYV